jgi:hypothetical protein
VNPVTQARQPAHDPIQQITALYQAHALGLVRLAFVLTGDRRASLPAQYREEHFPGHLRRPGLLGSVRRIAVTALTAATAAAARYRR